MRKNVYLITFDIAYNIIKYEDANSYHHQLFKEIRYILQTYGIVSVPSDNNNNHRAYIDINKNDSPSFNFDKIKNNFIIFLRNDKINVLTNNETI